jgi:glucan phosphoethanolaminetransferase (alkaline phosphatase superfamily)
MLLIRLIAIPLLSVLYQFGFIYLNITLRNSCSMKDCHCPSKLANMTTAVSSLSMFVLMWVCFYEITARSMDTYKRGHCVSMLLLILGVLIVTTF